MLLYDPLEANLNDQPIMLTSHRDRFSGLLGRIVMKNTKPREIALYLALKTVHFIFSGKVSSGSVLEEKLTNLESENKVLRQQALAMAQNNKLLSRSSRSIMQRAESTKKTADFRSASMNLRDQSDLEDRPQKSLNEKQQEYQDLLIRCVAQHLGFSRGRPVAACIIYKCLRQWRSFEVERTSIFDRIIQTIGHAIEKTQGNNEILAYWLSNASTLLLLLQRTLKAGGAAGAAPQHRRSTSATLFGKMTQSFRGSPRGVNLSLLSDDSAGSLRPVEAKYPALLFKQQLTAYVEKIYGMIRDNLKKEISPLLGLCIQAPRISRAKLMKGTARLLANAAAQEILIAHWQGIVKRLGNFLNILKTNHKPGGIIALLDEACMFPKSTHETFSQKLYQTFKSNKRFVKPKLTRTDFSIAHYAGEVQYQSDQFLDKNKDYVVLEHQELLCASKCSFVAGLFPPLAEESTKSSNKSSKFSSIGARFKIQLQQLMETLNSTEPHYIRCVKPNNLLKPSIFENVNILQQLRCGGVLEAIRISCAGYPTRRTFYEFLHRFSLLAPEVLEGNNDEKVACKKILEKMGLAGAQIGKTKVFLRAGQMAELDARRALKLSDAAKTIQRKTRTHIARKHFVALLMAVVRMQSICRGRLACKLYDNLKREAASLKIQTKSRGHLARKRYTRLKYSVTVLQIGMRAMAAHSVFRYKKQTKAATVIQAHWRGHRALSYYKRLIKASVVTQCRWRGRVARAELRKLKMVVFRLLAFLEASRETGALKEAKDKLEKQVEDLKLRLQLEKRLRTDMEEAKNQEISKLQHSLEAMQSKVDETNALLLKEREVAQKAIEEASSIVKETPVPVEDTEKIEALTAKVEKLKEMLQSEKLRADASERRCAEALESSEEKRQKLEETEKRVHQLQESLNSGIISVETLRWKVLNDNYVWAWKVLNVKQKPCDG
ncbi:hypothetical protein RD792_009473 [Penstemon davidsonii]|uniref:Uncharacterized protein n=1 Tax=Penstemon davidsonii TaxID=160366 RepID=A0ABR0D011_9LAMI|nr:hypothetical protein RD792_009473 [Penstemon davidsonii]